MPHMFSDIHDEWQSEVKQHLLHTFDHLTCTLLPNSPSRLLQPFQPFWTASDSCHFLKGEKKQNKKQKNPAQDRKVAFLLQIKSVLSRSTFAKGKTHFFAEVGNRFKAEILWSGRVRGRWLDPQVICIRSLTAPYQASVLCSMQSRRFPYLQGETHYLPPSCVTYIGIRM